MHQPQTRHKFYTHPSLFKRGNSSQHDEEGTRWDRSAISISTKKFLWSEDEKNDEIDYKRLQVFSCLDCLLEPFSRHGNSLTKRIGFMCFFNPESRLLID
ncbi:hypothetical protein Tco_1063755, partial [Tanacetum coccineum]